MNNKVFSVGDRVFSFTPDRKGEKWVGDCDFRSSRWVIDEVKKTVEMKLMMDNQNTGLRLTPFSESSR